MATQIQGQALRTNAYGPTVVRAALTLPATGSDVPLFSIVGGNVIITSMVGQITTVVQAQATTVQLGVFNTALNNITKISSAVADLNAAAVGTFVGLPAAGLGTGNALTFGITYANQNNEFIVGVGSIRATMGATSTGAWKWYLNYIPLDNGAYVAAA